MQGGLNSVSMAAGVMEKPLYSSYTPVYRVDRILTQLSLAGILGKISGFIFGRCTECGSGNSFGSLTLEQVLREHIEPLGVPAFSGSMIGHIDTQFTIPLGIDVQIDADAGTIRMLESGVV